jgi:mono/diheme cytochrome c family protein
MRARLLGPVLVILLLAAAFWWLSRPLVFEAGDLPPHRPDPDRGAVMFHAGGCASCHGARLEGGLEMATEFGVFRAPNISPHAEDGIGGWSALDFANAMVRGVSPRGTHYYPAFPYTSYARMELRDVLDLKAYLDTQEAVPGKAAAHDLGFPWNLRRGIGLWKRRYLDPEPVVRATPGEPAVRRGRYLVEGPGHCGECHTPRDRFGGQDRDRWLAGGRYPGGDGRVPNITPHENGLEGWSERDIAYYLQSGFTPDFDMVGGSMVKVQENIARLPAEDLAAIAAYLKAVPALPARSE